MFWFLIRFVVFIELIQYCESWKCESDHENLEIRLKNKLLCEGMDHEEKPESENGTLVRLKLFIKSFDYVDLNGELVVHSWLGMNWNDSRLKWNPQDYGDIKQLVLEGFDIWMPKLSLFNSPKSQFEENCAETPCHVTNLGQVSCIPPCTHNTFCKTNYKNWPFDIQNCTLHVGSWMHNANEIRFVEQQTDIEKSAIKHNDFKIIKIKVRNNIGKYKGYTNSYPSIHYNIVLERHATTEMAFIFSPAVIFAILNLSILWLAPNCGERIFMIILSMVLHFLILEQLSYIIPRNGDTVPVALLYFRDSLIISSILLVQTILCRGLLLYRKNSPQWMKSLTDTLRGHKVGQFMFENPYLINAGTNMQASEPSTNDSANLVDNEAGNNKTENATTSNSNLNTDNIWFFIVKIFDTLLFFILIICYIVMIIGWFPDIKSDYLDEKTVVVSNTTSTT